MQNVYLSIDTYEKKLNILFSEQDGNLDTATVFPLDLENDSIINNYCNYTKIFNETFIELLQINNISEANIIMSIPTQDVCIDYLSVPNIGGLRKNDDIFLQEIRKMYPTISKANELKYSMVKSSKTQNVYMYQLFSGDNLKQINSFLVNTNHNLTFLTSNAIASASFVNSIIGNNSLFNKDTYQFFYMRHHSSECALISNGKIYATYSIPMGTALLSGFNERDLIDYKKYNTIMKAASPLMNPFIAYCNKCNEIGLPEPKKIVMSIPDGYKGFIDVLNRDSDYNYERLVLPKEYSIFADNLELPGLFFNKVDKDNNFAINELKLPMGL